MKKSELDSLTKKFENLNAELINKKTLEDEIVMQNKSNISMESVRDAAAPTRKRLLTSNIMTDEEYLQWKKKMLDN